MRYVVDAKGMQEIDRKTIEVNKIPAILLMEQAALAVAQVVEAYLTFGENKAVVCCGKGNNGADGIACGRILAQRGYEVLLVLPERNGQETKEYLLQLEIASAIGIKQVAYHQFCCEKEDVIVDAIFGVGLNRIISKSYIPLFNQINECKKAYVVAVDLPSGISATTGEILGCVIKADITVTFGYDKIGIIKYPGKTYAGKKVIADIGFSHEIVNEIPSRCMVLEEQDLNMIPIREEDSNKGSYGKVLVIAGSKGMCGAAYLSAAAAYAVGAGLVKILTVEENREILQMQLPEAIIASYEPEQVLERTFPNLIQEHCKWATSIVIGPGLGKESYVVALLETILAQAFSPMVLDADALNCIAENPYLSRYYTENMIITPHIKEMNRLCGESVEEIKKKSVEQTKSYSEHHGITCVLKDSVSVIVDKDKNTYLNTSGSSALAKAGSGDVLAGIIGGLLAMGTEVGQAAAMGSFIHGLAGQKAADIIGTHGVLAHNVIEYLGKIVEGKSDGRY